MLHDPWFYAAAVPAMILLGLSKGGFSSMGMLAVPILALVISPVQAAGITLPILVLSDIVAVVAYWRVFDKRTVRIMLPGAVVGIFIGWLTAAWVTEHEIRLIVGLISVLFALNYWFRHRLQQHAAWSGCREGHVLGNRHRLHVIRQPRRRASVSALRRAAQTRARASSPERRRSSLRSSTRSKPVPYFFLGQFDIANLTASAILLPISIPATFVGVWLVKKIELEAFYKIVYLLIFIVGIYLVWEGLSEIF